MREHLLAVEAQLCQILNDLKKDHVVSAMIALQLLQRRVLRMLVLHHPTNAEEHVLAVDDVSSDTN